MNTVHTPVACQSFYMAAGGSTCLAWLHVAQGQPRGINVLMCQAIGYEAMCAYGAYRQISQALAQAGFNVLRFDYPGTGDASGSDADWGAGAALPIDTLPPTKAICQSDSASQ